MSSILRFLIRIGETCISQESRFYLPALSYLHRLNGLFAPMSAAVKIAEPTGIALDVGANLGMFSYELRRSFPKVVAFEPNGELSACLRALKDEQITLNNFSLSSKTGTTTLHVPVVGSTAYNGWATLDADSPSLAEFKDTGAELKPLTVEMFRLDDLGFSMERRKHWRLIALSSLSK